MRWRLPRPIKPLEKPIPQPTGLFWTIGKILTPLAPLAAVSFLAVPTAFVTWLVLNARLIGRKSHLLGHYHINLPTNLVGTEWFVGALIVLLILGVLWPRGFLAVIGLFWFLIIILLAL